ncbi:MAG: nucleolar RNA-binding Nop10p family protein [Nanoarchaeota archaeon]|nr:nucleolar RNA-binding Nop10p family protein [Nanoarchaeota archaeon]
MNRIRFCEKCKTYTLEERCRTCGNETVIKAPIKYIKDENISYYRRKIKKEEWIRRNLL